MNRFKNTRVRLTRTSDGQVFGGWFLQSSGNRFTVDCGRGFASRSGEMFRLHAANAGCTVDFDTLHVQTSNRGSEFALPPEVRFEHTKEAPRFRTSDLDLRLLIKLGAFDATLIDVSEGGLGLLAYARLKVGDAAKLHVEGAGFDGCLDVECRFCKPEPQGGFRFGFLITTTDRFLRARWVKYVGSVESVYSVA